MNKGEMPNGADTPKPVVFSSGNTVISTLGAVFASEAK